MSRSWVGVPLDKISEWRSVFAASTNGVDVEGRCPVCGSNQLHRYYQVGAPIDRTAGPEHFIARGGCWEWCSGCSAYVHSSALVPDWWRSDLAVDESKLTALPEVLQAAIEERSRGR